MASRRYRTVEVKSVPPATIEFLAEQDQVVIAVDVAKYHQVALVTDAARQKQVFVRWDQPQETRPFLELAAKLNQRGRAEVVLEPTGTYGDSLRYQLEHLGLKVYRVSPKRVHDASEEYDGVPSQHDAKAAAVIADLHLRGKSERWVYDSARDRELAAVLAEVEWYHVEHQRYLNRLEAWLARYWPEVEGYLEKDSATLLALLERYGGPGGVRTNARQARMLMAQVGGSRLRSEKIEGVVESAVETLGVPMVGEEERVMRALAKDIQELKRKEKVLEQRVKALQGTDERMKRMSEVLGSVTALVVLTRLGDPEGYKTARAYEKSAGLNLTECSSGEKRGLRRISKRGSGLVRYYLYLAVLRLVQEDEVVREWYARKVARDGGKYKKKGIVAIMRKLVRGLWHVGRGAEFDTRRMFDVRALGMDAGVKA